MNGVGISVAVSFLGGSVSKLAEELRSIKEWDFDCAELPILGIDAIIGGRVQPDKLNRIREATDQFDLRYTVHAPNSLNLAAPRSRTDGVADLSREKELFASCLEFCSGIGAEVMVYHCGVKERLKETLKSEDAIRKAEEQERDALQELAPVAENLDVIVGVENTDQSASVVLKQVTAIESTHIGMTLDLAHLFLASNELGFDYLASVEEAAPLTRHIHTNDNLGREGVSDAYANRIAFGDGDLHLPIGWGEVPHSKAVDRLADFGGLYVLEVSYRFRDHFDESLEEVRKHLKKTEQPGV